MYIRFFSLKQARQFFEKRRILFLLSLINLIAVVITFRGNYYISYLDGFFPPNPYTAFVSSLYSWNYLFGSGMPNSGSNALVSYFLVIFLLSRLLFSLTLTEAFLAFFCVELATIGMFRLISEFSPRTSEASRLLGSLFYFYNPYVIIEYFSDPPNQWLVLFSSLPLLILLIRRLITTSTQQRRLPFYELSSLFVLLIIATPGIEYGQEPSVLAFLGSLVLIEIASLYKTVGYKIWRAVAVIIILSTAYVLANLYWGYAFTYAFALDIKINSVNSLFLAGSSAHTSIFNVIRLVGENQWYNPKGYQMYSFSSYYTGGSLWFSMILLLTPLLVLIGILFQPMRRIDYFFAAWLLLSVLLSVGEQPPIGSIIGWIVNHVTVGYWLRNPYQVVGWIQVFCYSYFICRGSDAAVTLVLKKKHSLATKRRSDRFSKFAALDPRVHHKRVGSASIILVLIMIIPGIIAFPIWSGSAVPGAIVSNDQPSAHVSIPGYYFALAHYLNEHPGHYRVLDLPSPGVLTRDNWTNGYWSGSFLWDLTNVPIYEGNYENAPLTMNIINSINDLIAGRTTGNLSRVLYALDIGYVLVRHDEMAFNQGQTLSNASLISKILSSQANIKEVAVFGKIQVFSLSEYPGVVYSANPLFVNQPRNAILSSQNVWNLSGYINENSPQLLFQSNLSQSFVSDQTIYDTNSTSYSNFTFSPNDSGHVTIWNRNSFGWNLSDVPQIFYLTFNMRATRGLVISISAAYSSLQYNVSAFALNQVTWSNVLQPISTVTAANIENNTTHNNIAQLAFQISKSSLFPWQKYLDFVMLNISSPSSYSPSPYLNISLLGLETNLTRGIGVTSPLSDQFTSNGSISIVVPPGTTSSSQIYTTNALGIKLTGEVIVKAKFSSTPNVNFWPMWGATEGPNATSSVGWNFPSSWSPSWALVHNPDGSLSTNYTGEVTLFYSVTYGSYLQYFRLILESNSISSGNGSIVVNEFDLFDKVIHPTTVDLLAYDSLPLNTVIVHGLPPGGFNDFSLHFPNIVVHSSDGGSVWVGRIAPIEGSVFIAFLESYSPLWQFEVTFGKATLVKSFLIDGFANGFLLNVSNTSVIFQISYKPQHIEVLLQYLAPIIDVPMIAMFAVGYYRKRFKFNGYN